MIGGKIDIAKIAASINRYFSHHRGDELPRGIIEILEDLTRPQYKEVLKHFEQENAQYYVALRRTIILWDDLVELSSQDVILVTREIEPTVIGLALRLGDESLRHNFLSNMPLKDREIAQSLIDGAPVAKIEVISAIKRILKIVRAKVEANEISLAPRD
jgi:flagellar motor switch protein FliG